MNLNTSTELNQSRTGVANRVLRNAYLLLATTLIPTMIGALIGIQLSWNFFASSPIISCLGTIALMYGFTFLISKNQNSGAGVAFLLCFTFFMGLLLGPILQVTMSLRNGGALLMYASGSTAFIFFALSSWIQATGKDLSGMGRFLFVGCLVLLTAMLANAFLRIPALSLTITAAIALFSTLGLAHSISQAVNGGQTNYVMLTMTLYMDLFNLFISLLRLLIALGGQSRD